MVLTPQLAHPQEPQLPEHWQVEQSQGDIFVLVGVFLETRVSGFDLLWVGLEGGEAILNWSKQDYPGEGWVI